MNTTSWLGVLLATAVAGCGGVVMEDGKSLNAKTRASVEQALARCEGSVTDMSWNFRGPGATAEALPTLIEGRWARCPEQNAQFKESFGVEISKDAVCPLEPDATGSLTAHVAPSCVQWKASPPPFEGVQFDEIITGADFSTDGKLFRACANPYCAVYVRIE